MERELNELELVQNPALGAYLIWRFGASFQSERHAYPAFALIFLVLPLLFHRPTLKLVSSTRRGSGLALFAAKLNEQREDLLAVHNRALALRRLTLQSAGFAIQSGLVKINYLEATLQSNHSLKGKPVPERITELVKAAEKIGIWFSALNVSQIAMTLKVDF